MKKTNKFLMLITLFTFFIHTLQVSAGNVNLGFSGYDTVKVNNTIDITVHVSDIQGLTSGLATAQGDIAFDTNYLEYVSFKPISSNLSVSYGAKTKRFVALGLGGEYVTNSDNLFTITFKAKAIGQTTLNITDTVIGDTKAIIHGATVVPKTIQIVGETTTPTTPTTPTNPTKPNNGTTNNSSSNKNNNTPTTNTNKSNNANLETLTVNDAKMNQAFDKNVTTYDVTVSKDVTKLELYYKTSSDKASVKVVGNENLKEGVVNTVEIVVTAEDGTTKKYTLYVTKSDTSTSNKLSKLEVAESSLYPKFDADVNEYKLKISDDIDELTIDAIAADPNSTVEIIGNSNLKKNKIVLIKVTDRNNFSNYYKLNTEPEKEFKIFGIDIKYILWGLGILIILLLFFIFLILLKRRKKEKEKPMKVQIIDDEYRESKNEDLYDDIVTKDEIIGAIEEQNMKKLKMLLTQEEANKLKEEVKKEEKQ